MRRIDQWLAVVCIIFSFSCTQRGSTIQKQGAEVGDDIDLSLEYNYDTLEGTFLFESYVESYITGEDAVTKSGGLVKDSSSINLNTYKTSYYVCDLNLVKKSARINPILKYKPSSISLLQSHLTDLYWTHSGHSESEFNPYCGLFYKRFFLNIVVANIGHIRQKTPLFLDCEDFQKYKKENKGRNYEHHALPTYLIVDVISWKEIN